jgi:hypothetical protein
MFLLPHHKWARLYNRLPGGYGNCDYVARSDLCAAGVPPLNIPVCQSRFGVAGGPARNATLHHAAAVALDDSGNLYIADTINHRIRRVDASSALIYSSRTLPIGYRRNTSVFDAAVYQLKPATAQQANAFVRA